MIESLEMLLSLSVFMVGMASSGGSGEKAAEIYSNTLSRLKDKTEAIEENDIYEFAVKIRDPEILETIINRKQAWQRHRGKFGFEGMPYEETDDFKDIVRKFTSLGVGEAVDKEKWAHLKYMTRNAEKPRIRDWNMLQDLIGYIQRGEDDPFLAYLAGQMGSGKTDFALLLGQIWKLLNEDGVIVTNVKSASNTVYVDGQDALQEWKENNPNKPFLFIFDEASDTADSRGDSSAVHAQLSPFLKYIRKDGGNMIIIGHTGKDVAAEVRRLTDYIQKVGKKKATVYEGVDENGDGETPKFSLRGIPPTNIDFDTREDSDWSWSDELLQRCFGTNSSGERCGMRFHTENDRVFCSTHIDQEEPHPDVPDARLEGTDYEELMSDDTDDEKESEDDETPSSSAADVEEEESQENDENGTEDDEIESETPTPEDTADDSPESSEQSEARDDENEGGDLERVPDQYWDIVEDRTGGAYTRDNVDALEQLEQLLNNTQWDRLQSQLED